MGTKRKSAMKVAVILILFLAFPGGVYADSPDFLSLFRFDFGVQEEYTDNVDYSPSNTRDDWITRVYGGSGCRQSLPRSGPPARCSRNPWVETDGESTWITAWPTTIMPRIPTMLTSAMREGWIPGPRSAEGWSCA